MQKTQAQPSREHSHKIKVQTSDYIPKRFGVKIKNPTTISIF